MSGDGSVVVGTGSSASGVEAFVWTSSGGMGRLWDVLLASGVNPAASGWTGLSGAYAITPDGNTIVGSGTRNGNTEAFVAVVPEPASLSPMALGGIFLLRRRRRCHGGNQHYPARPSRPRGGHTMRSNSYALLGLLLALFIAGFGVEDAAAQLNGTTVNVSAYFPNSSSVFENPGNCVVGAGVEYPAGSYDLYGPDWQIDITDNKLIITWMNPEEGDFQPGAFNGFILDTLATPITSASVGPTRDFYPVSLTVNGNRIEANFQNEYVPPGPSSAIISIVPEPGGAAVLSGLGLAILGQRRRH